MIRRRRGDLVVLAAGSAIAAFLAPSISWGAGKTYEVVQCDPLNRGVSGMTQQDAPSYAVRQTCGDAQNDHAIKINNTRFARHGGLGRVTWSTGSPVLRIVGAHVQAWLRRTNGHAARLFVADAEGNEIARVAAGHDRPSTFKNYGWRSSTVRPQRFVAQLRCERASGCPHSEIAKTWLRNVHFEVADYADPVLQEPNGSLLDGGWIRGQRSFNISATDAGSGIQSLSVRVNGSVIRLERGDCAGTLRNAVTAMFRPCQPQRELDANMTTAGTPFMDGRNLIAACVVDFARNETCVKRAVRVDNTAPSVAFTNLQNPNDPELVRAHVSDRASGVRNGRIFYRPAGSTASWRPLETQLRAGALQTRVKSTIDPPGAYEFLAMATDAAGNASLTTQRADGRPMILRFPLKAGVRLSGHLTGGTSHLTVDYGRPSRVSGTLTDVTGEPLRDQQVTVTEYFGAGALIDRRIRTVTTDAQGHWKERLPGGPSRKVMVSFAGTRRYLSDSAKVGRLAVRTKATLRLSRRKVLEGHRIAFKGRVGHLAARIPPGGKLVELEVKDGHSWQTVRHPFYTRPNGKYKLRYRFARFYTQNVHYRFRVRVLREHHWPYKAPANSRVRELVVRTR